MRLVAPLAAALALPAPAAAQTLAEAVQQASQGVGRGAALAREIAKTAEQVKKNAFETARGLREYEVELGGEFHAALLGLKPGQRWLDVGAGQAVAASQYLDAGGPARVVAVTVEKPRPSPGVPDPQATRARFGAGRFAYLVGRPIEAYSAAQLGRADLITDVYGAMVYAPRLDEVVRKLGELARPGAKVYTLLPQTLDDLDGNTTIVDVRGRQVPLAAWLGAVEGFRLDWSPDSLAFTLTRTDEPLAVPPLELVGFDGAAMIPVRAYRWDGYRP